jgi:hypothetical protein
VKSALAIPLLAACLLSQINQDPPSLVKVKILHDQRIAALKQLEQITVDSAKNDKATELDVLKAHRLVRSAMLDACMTFNERIAALESIVELEQKIEAASQVAAKKEQIGMAEAIKSTADRLKAEIDLARAKLDSDKFRLLGTPK